MSGAADLRTISGEVRLIHELGGGIETFRTLDHLAKAIHERRGKRWVRVIPCTGSSGGAGADLVGVSIYADDDWLGFAVIGDHPQVAYDRVMSALERTDPERAAA